MRLFLFALFLVIYFPFVTAGKHSEKFVTSNEVLRFCRISILELTDEKIHLRPDRINFFRDRFFILNDFHDWVAIRELHKDHHGFFIFMENPLCPFDHPGVKRVKFTWFCLDNSCPFFLHNHFKDGKFFREDFFFNDSESFFFDDHNFN